MQHSSQPSITNPIYRYIGWLKHPSNMAQQLCIPRCIPSTRNIPPVHADTLISLICLRPALWSRIHTFLYTMASGVATMARLLLVLAQLSVVSGLPAGGAVQDERDVAEREIPTPSSIPPTTSYSTAITTLQSVPISILPSITGVCTLRIFHIWLLTDHADTFDRAFSQDCLLGVSLQRIL